MCILDPCTIVNFVQTGLSVGAIVGIVAASVGGAAFAIGIHLTFT